jgi:hypothetical protein
VKQVTAKALELLARRNEINQRIRHLNNVMRGLRTFASRAYVTCDSPHTASACATEATTTANSTVRKTAEWDWSGSSLRGPARHVKGELTRACRIALIEVGGSASADDIRGRIVRRGSFSFADPGSAEVAILRTLKFMSDSGEVRRLEVNSQSLWQRTEPRRETET